MENKVARYFRDQFRKARAEALRDAEGFQETVFVLERLGVYLTGKTTNLGKYKKDIEKEARESPLADVIPNQHPSWHSSFSTIYDVVRKARNDALHQGAFARHLTHNAIHLALVLEDALMSKGNTVGDYMVMEPICASGWQPLSFVRQQMLKNSFTYLPLLPDNKSDQQWRIVSDYHIARYLLRGLGERKNYLAETLDKAILDGLEVEQADTCSTGTSVQDALEMSKGKPLIVIDRDPSKQLVGIITPFDFL